MMLLLPELSMLLLSVVFLFLSLADRKESLFFWARAMALAGLVMTLAGVAGEGELFSGAYRVDLFSQIFKVLISVGFCYVVFMFGSEDEVDRRYLPDYLMFLTFSTLGLMMLASAVELISIVISLEISSFSLYAVVPLRKSQTKLQLEAAVKYLFFGAVSTGVMLFGMGYLYAMAGSTFLADIVRTLPAFISQPIGILALILTMTGFFFKLSLFPLHFWAPDIYEGASNTTTTFIATVPKIAAVALLVRIAMLAPSVSPPLANILIILAALSMTMGNLVGLIQRDVKRLLAYSGIAHAGYLMLGVISLNSDGGASAIYYIAIYLFMNLACFYVIILMSRSGENVMVDDLAGLSRRSPLLALTLAVSAFSLAGIPPTGGFTGKFFLFVSAFQEGYLTIVIIGAVNTVISIFYYLNLVRMSYSREPESRPTIALHFHEKALCYTLIFMILYMGLVPFGLLDIFQSAF
ncbi:MAG: NADH-quinone oxidoreductase subunit N [Deltaproteobacteria bacterium]|nr:NADH-quinone oxidoreductase subunit N [Deltaproteobacteria bacterium]